MPFRRPLVASLLVGLLHAGLLLAVALDLGYAVGPSEYSLLGVGWRYAGLAVVAALPIWLALRHGIVAPVVALVLTTGYVLGAELTPPEPTFRDVAELERLAEPTGITAVEDGLFIVKYMVNASVWAVGFLFVGLVEHAVRTAWRRLPPVASLRLALPVPASRRRAVAIAAVGGLLHAVAMTWFAARLGVTLTGGFDPLLYASGTVGMWLLAAVPLYLLFRHQLVSPAALLTALVLLDVRSEFTASVDGPHALYFGAWFMFLAILLVAAGVEYGLRRLDAYRRLASASEHLLIS